MNKMYVVTMYSGYNLIGASRPFMVFKEKIQAEYFAEYKSKEGNRGDFMNYNHYFVVEVELNETDHSKDKGFKEFIKGKVKEVEEKIVSEKNCIESDFEDVRKLSEEKESLAKLLDSK